MTDKEISYLLLLGGVLWFGIYLGAQLTEPFKRLRQRMTKALIRKLWFSMPTDCIKCHTGEIIFVENCDIEGDAYS